MGRRWGGGVWHRQGGWGLCCFQLVGDSLSPPPSPPACHMQLHKYIMHRHHVIQQDMAWQHCFYEVRSVQEDMNVRARQLLPALQSTL